MKVTLKATAPTIYQRQSLAHFGMPINNHLNGSYTAKQEFESEQDAKKYLIERAENYFESEAELIEALRTIEDCGILQIDAVSASIEEVYLEE